MKSHTNHDHLLRGVHMQSKTIFVAISAFNEPELQQTVDSALEMADNPENIYFGISAHYRDMSFPDFRNYKNVRVVNVDSADMLGTGMMMSLANNLYLDQDYFLQIDGHMLFQRHWDTLAISKLEMLLSFCDKPVITNYVPWWSSNEDGSINFYNPDQKEHQLVIQYMDIDHPHNHKFDYPLQNGYSVDWTNLDYVEHGNFSGHFVFTLPSYREEAAADPLLMYSGEEQCMALRLWTRGYRMFAIPDPIVWHKNKGHGYVHPNDRWTHPSTEGFINWWQPKDEYSRERTFKFLTGKEFGFWGAPSQEHLQKYEEFVNIDFKEYYKKLSKFAERV